jgi:ribosome-associated protein
VCDYFVICSANVELHAQAIADYLKESLEKNGARVWHMEGYNTGRWILLDYVDVVVHIFLKGTRDFYALEKLWGDSPLIDLSLKEERKEKKTKNLKK